MNMLFSFFQRNKAPYEEAIPLLMPQQHMVIPHYRGQNKEKEVERKDIEDNVEGITRQDSFSSSSSLQDIPLLLPQEADGPDGSGVGPKRNGLESTPGRSHPHAFRKSKIESIVPDMPMTSFVDDHDSLNLHVKMSPDLAAEPGTKTSDLEWWESPERVDQIGSVDESGQVGSRVSCHCQVGYCSRYFMQFL
jgi:phospholipase D1/2